MEMGGPIYQPPARVGAYVPRGSAIVGGGGGCGGGAGGGGLGGGFGGICGGICGGGGAAVSQGSGASSGSSGCVSFLVPNDRSPRVIGKAGAGLKAIREACGMKVEAKPEVEGGGTEPIACRLSMSGTMDQIHVAFAVALKRAYPEEERVTATLRIPSEWAGRAIGKGAENLKKARNIGVVSQVGREKYFHPVTGVEERPVTLEGPTESLPQALAIMLGLGEGALVPSRGSALSGIVGPAKSSMVVNVNTLAMPVQAASPGPGGPPKGLLGANDLGWGPTSADEVCLHLMVADSMAGAVLGRGGGKIKDTATKAGCKVRMTCRTENLEPRRVIIVGAFHQVANAQMLLNDQLREAYMAEGYPEPTGFAITMVLRNEVCGAIIGKQGSGIKTFRERTGTKIVLQHQSDVEHCRPCQIEGSLQAVLEAERLIHEAQLQIPWVERPKPGDDGSIGGQPHPSQIVGGMFAASAADPGGALFLVDPAAKRRRMEPEAQEPEPECKILVPEQTVGTVIGKQGANLKGVREKLGVRVEVKKPEEAPHWVGDRLVIFKGPTANRALAVEQVLTNSVLRHASQASLPTFTCKVLVPVAKIGHVVGEAGSILRWLQENYQVQPIVDSQEINGEHLLAIHGAPAYVVEAIKQVIGLLDRNADQASGELVLQQQQQQQQQQYGGGACGMVSPMADPAAIAYGASIAQAVGMTQPLQQDAMMAALYSAQQQGVLLDVSQQQALLQAGYGASGMYGAAEAQAAAVAAAAAGGCCGCGTWSGF